MVMYQLIGGGGNPIVMDNYLTIVALEDGLTAKLSRNACEYCVDGDENWKTLSAATNTEAINKGHTLSFRGNLTPVTSNGIGTFTISKSCNLEGNCMSMLFGNDSASNISLRGKDYAFYRLFKNCTTIKSVSSGFLPAMTLVSSCYSSMFYGCTNLTQSPELPATTLANQCYYYMFKNCTNLTTAPELPAMTLSNYCYSHMFDGCVSLTSIPSILPATSLAGGCYMNMFYNCSRLTTAPELPSTNLANQCYSSMFYGCTKLTQPPSLPATTITDHCYRNMFYNCTSLSQAPKLPATSLSSYCYNFMFWGCTSLTTAPELPATTLADYCYTSMFKGCTKLNYIKALFTTTPSDTYTGGWVDGVASTGTFVKNPNATWNVIATSDNNYIGIPSGWTVEDNATITKCKTLTISAEDVGGRYTTTNVSWVAICDAVDNNSGNAVEVRKTGTFESEPFPQNTSTTETITRTISFTYMGVTASTTFVHGIYIANEYTVDLNSQWRLSSNISNPNSSLYDGVYESYSNYNVNSGTATMTINIAGYTSFSVYIRSYAESNYDYVMISQLDKSITGSTSYSSSDVKAHTRGSQQSGTAISNYKLVEYTNIDGGEHTITIVYRKDSSANSGDDRGYVLIKK